MNKRTIKLLTTLGSASIVVGGCGLVAGPQKPAPVKKATQATRKAANKATTTVKKAGTSGTTTAPRPAHLKVIAFYDQTMAHVSPDPFTFVKAHPSLVTYLSPFWYEVTPTGTVIAKPEGNAATLAKEAHLPLMPLFNNYMGTDGMLSTAALRTKAVDSIVQLVTSHHYAGVQIDFQQLKPADRSLLVMFMNELHAKMPASAAISMSVVPLTAGTGQAGAYDLKSLAPDVSSMVLMAYDLHSNGTPPGPVSPYPWVKQSINLALKAGVSPSKLYLGIADYGYLWKAGSDKATTIPLKVMYQHKYGAYTWDPTNKEAYDHYTSHGVSYTLWFVNDRGAADRIKLAQKDHLGGVGFWRVGYEDAQWWNRVAKALNNTAKKSAPAAAGAKASAMAPPASPQHRSVT